MQTAQTNIFCYLIVVILGVLSTLCRAENDDGMHLKPCDISFADEQCGKNERCVSSNNEKSYCECQREFHLVHGECIRITSAAASVDAITSKPDIKSESEGGSSVAAGLLIPTFLVVVGVLLYFSARRYKWLQRFRQYRQNHYGNVLVPRDDDDDDDPPIA
ncbi:uncharacterized protein [Anoplolepis gracilipes]|uniref:uncharacterized protein n=1 Tax=Anoplolepis gracilipes TaxID=354296 RepID=UPI003BA278BD